MSVITDITPQKRKPNIFNIYIDNRFSFSLSDLDLSLFHLSVGQSLTTGEQNKLINQSQFSKAYNKALNYISYRMRSEWEVESYLTRNEFNKNVVQKVIQKLKNNQTINDLDFATRWINDRTILKSKSKRALKAELIKKHIDSKILDEVLSEINEEVELENLIKLIAKKQKIARYKNEKKLLTYLQRQGFSYRQIKLALELSASQH